MKPTTDPGIDYSGPLSTANRDPETHIRYGVICSNDVNTDMLENIYQYGRDLGWEQAVLEFKGCIEDCLLEAPAHEADSWVRCEEETRRIMADHFSEWKSRGEKVSDLDIVKYKILDAFKAHFGQPIKEMVEAAYDAVKSDFDDAMSACMEGGPMLYERKGYVLKTNSYNDIWVIKSPCFTYAEFCSPCAPGAVYLTNALDIEGDLALSSEMRDRYYPNRGYCLGHDWFEDDQAPYPVFSVETGQRIISKQVDVECPICAGSGDDTVTRIARVRDCAEQEVIAQMISGELPVQRFNAATNTFDCNRCQGKGEIKDTEFEEV